MDEAVRKFVRERAKDVCEYCRLVQVAQPWVRFQIDHIRPRQHGGTDDVENLCLACSHCNRFKGPNLASIDSMTNQLTPLFDPRTEDWHEHFLLDEHLITGRTPQGRVTAAVLNMNAADRVQLRMELSSEGLPEIG